MYRFGCLYHVGERLLDCDSGGRSCDVSRVMVFVLRAHVLRICRCVRKTRAPLTGESSPSAVYVGHRPHVPSLDMHLPGLTARGVAVEAFIGNLFGPELRKTTTVLRMLLPRRLAAQCPLHSDQDVTQLVSPLFGYSHPISNADNGRYVKLNPAYCIRCILAAFLQARPAGTS